MEFYSWRMMTDSQARLPECISRMVGQHIESPRKEFSGKWMPQGFLIEKLDEEGQKVVIRFDSKTRLELHFWRFNLVYNILHEANGNYVAVGSRIDPEKTETIESRLYEEAKKMNYPSARLRTAAFICDLMVLCKIAQYGVIRNPETGRTVQAIRMLK